MKKAAIKAGIAALMIGIAVPLALWQMKRSDLEEAAEYVKSHYPLAELLETVRSGGILPDEMSAYCFDTDYGFIFRQNFSRDGRTWYTTDVPGSYEGMKEHRQASDRVLAFCGDDAPPHTVIYTAKGFCLATECDDPAVLEPLFNALLPAAQAEEIPFSIISAPTRYSIFKNTDFAGLWCDAGRDGAFADSESEYFEMLYTASPNVASLFGWVDRSTASLPACIIRPDRDKSKDADSSIPYADTVTEAFAVEEALREENPLQYPQIIWEISYPHTGQITLRCISTD